MKKYIILFFAIFLFRSVKAQDNGNTYFSPIALSVITPKENLVEGLSDAQLTRLRTKIISLVTENGLSSDGSEDGFVIYPLFQITDWQTTQSTIRAIKIANCVFSLFIKQVVPGSKSNIIFNSYTRDIQGSGFTEQEAIANALQQIKPGEKRMQDFFEKAKGKIQSYYVQNCSRIIQQAQSAANIENYPKAFALLQSIPQEAGDCYSQVQQKTIEIYLKVQKQECGKFILDAKTYAAQNDFEKALASLRQVDPESVCKEDLWTVLNEIEPKVDEQQKANIDLFKEIMHNQAEIEKARIAASHDLAKAYLQGNKRNYKIVGGSGGNAVIEEELPVIYDNNDGRSNDKNKNNKVPDNGGNRTSSSLLTSTTLKPAIRFENNIFPSFIISRTSVNSAETMKEYGAINDCIGFTISNPSASGTLTYTIEPGEDKYFSSITGTITFVQNQPRTFFPEIPWKFDALRGIQQSTPVTIKFRLSDNTGKTKEEVTKVNFRSIRECITMYQQDGKLEISPAIAAYVNEENPEIDKLLKIALDKSWINSWVGYQFGEEGVNAQLMAIWKILSSKGIKYSSITGSTSNVTHTFYSQTVRPFCQSVYNKQANCVDGTLVFASILKAIDIRPALVLIPGHCFLAFHRTNGDAGDYIFLETTLLGNIKGTPTEKAMEDNFNEAIKAGEEAFKKADKNTRNIIDVEAARQQGIKPINLSDEFCK